MIIRRGGVPAGNRVAVQLGDLLNEFLRRGQHEGGS